MKPTAILLPTVIKGNLHIVTDVFESMVFTQGDNEIKLKMEQRYVFTKDELQRLLTSLVSCVSLPYSQTQKKYDDSLKERGLL